MVSRGKLRLHVSTAAAYAAAAAVAAAAAAAAVTTEMERLDFSRQRLNSEYFRHK